MSALEGLSRDGAREAAREELSRPVYDTAEPALLVRVLDAALEQLGRLLDAAAGLPGGAGGAVLLLLLLVGLAVLVAVRLGPLGRERRSGRRALDGGARLSADGHRTAAESAASRGDHAEAVRERLRAVVRELEERGVLDVRPGRTAGEVARDGGAALPALAQDLRAAAGTFDAVWYGGRPADAGTYAALVAVDDRVRGRVRG